MEIPIYLDGVSGPVLKNVLEWCEHNKDYQYTENYMPSEWELEYISRQDSKMAHDITSAAKVMQIDGLIVFCDYRMWDMIYEKSHEVVRVFFEWATPW